MEVAEQRRSLPSRGVKGSTRIWMQEKAKRDQQLYNNQNDPNLWIVENKLYDLDKFAESHPGGSSWISKTKGQDITQHFIIHHLNETYARTVLDKYYVKDCQQQRTRFTFHPDGLYRTIKTEVLKQFTPKQLQNETMSQINGIILLVVFLSCLTLTAYFSSYLFATVCSVLLIGIVGIAHNFVHHKENVFRYFFLLTGFTHHQWQIMHCISHHMYPNTQLDYQIGAFQPFAYFLRNSPPNWPYTTIVLQLLSILLVPLNILLKVFIVPMFKVRLPDFWYLSTLGCFLVFYLFSNDWWVAFKLYFYMYGLFGYLLLRVLFCGHRLQQLWSQGARKIEDYGEHTVLATSDTDVSFTGMLSIVMFAGFNIHVAHHLFPTADHQILPQIMKIVQKVCQDKNIKYTKKNRLECIKSVSAGITQKLPFSSKTE